MELVFNRNDVTEAMKMVSGAAGKVSALPVLSNVLISAAQDPLGNLSGSSEGDGDSIYLAATDLEIGMRTRIAGQITESGAILLPARTFTDVVGALREDDVRLVVSNGRARICSQKGEFKMKGTSAVEFPLLMGEVSQNAQLELAEQPRDEKEMNLFSLEPDILQWMARKTAFATSKDAARYFLNGVHLSLRSEGDGTMLRMAATDGTRLAVASTIMETALEKEIEAIIPFKAVRELEKLPVSSGVMKIGVQENRMVFDAGHTALVSTLLEGQYPDYQKIIPHGSLINLKADTGELMAVVRRISQVCNPKLPCVKLEIAGNGMKVSADSQYIGDGCEEMDIEKDGHDVAIAVNARYLMDALRIIDTQETLIGIDSEAKPIVIRPSSGDGDICASSCRCG